MQRRKWVNTGEKIMSRQECHEIPRERRNISYLYIRYFSDFHSQCLEVTSLICIIAVEFGRQKKKRERNLSVEKESYFFCFFFSSSLTCVSSNHLYIDYSKRKFCLSLDIVEMIFFFWYKSSHFKFQCWFNKTFLLFSMLHIG